MCGRNFFKKHKTYFALKNIEISALTSFQSLLFIFGEKKNNPFLFSPKEEFGNFFLIQHNLTFLFTLISNFFVKGKDEIAKFIYSFAFVK